MWIKTQGGYLLNLDRMDYVIYKETENVTYAATNKSFPHIIGENNLTTMIADNIARGTKLLEVR